MEMNKVGTFIVLLIGILVVTAMFNGISSPVAQTTDTFTNVNESVAWVAVGGNITYSNAQEISDIVITNATNGALIPSSNYTAINNILSNGVLISKINRLNGTSNALTNTSTVNVSYTYEPYGFINEAGSRSVVDLIPLLAALALAIFVLYYAYREINEAI